MRFRIEWAVVLVVIIAGIVWKKSRPSLKEEAFAPSYRPAIEATPNPELVGSSGTRDVPLKPTPYVANCTTWRRDLIYMLRPEEHRKMKLGSDTLEVTIPEGVCWREGRQLLLVSVSPEGRRSYRGRGQILQLLPGNRAKIQVYEAWLGKAGILPRICFTPCDGVIENMAELKKLGAESTLLFVLPKDFPHPEGLTFGKATVKYIEVEDPAAWSAEAPLNRIKDFITNKNLVIAFDRPFSKYDPVLEDVKKFAYANKVKTVRFFHPGLNGLDGLSSRPPVPPGVTVVNAASVLELKKRKPDLKILFLRPDKVDYDLNWLEPKLEAQLIRTKSAGYARSYQSVILGSPDQWIKEIDLGRMDLQSPTPVLLFGTSNLDWNVYYLSRTLMEKGWTDISIVRGGYDEYAAYRDAIQTP